MDHALRRVAFMTLQTLACLGETEDAWLYSDPDPQGIVQHLALNKATYPECPSLITIEIRVLETPGETPAP